LPLAYTEPMHIFVEDISGDCVNVLGDDAHHLVSVRRVRLGEKFPLIDLSGDQWALGRISHISRHAVEFFVESRQAKPEPQLPCFILYPALIKRLAMETILQRSVELGVDSIYPVKANRSIPDMINKKRWETIVKEASMQSHRFEIPIIGTALSLQELAAYPEAPIIVMTTQQTGIDLKTWVDSQINPPQSIGILVGPEGGWTLTEEAFFLQMGWALVSFGKSIMRADTASMGVLSALRYAYHTVL